MSLKIRHYFRKILILGPLIKVHSYATKMIIGYHRHWSAYNENNVLLTVFISKPRPLWRHRIYIVYLRAYMHDHLRINNFCFFRFVHVYSNYNRYDHHHFSSQLQSCRHSSCYRDLRQDSLLVCLRMEVAEGDLP